MKTLIIGGTGTISTAITQELVELGDDVTIYNRGQRTVDIPDGYKLITGDRKDYAAFESQMRDAGTFDCVIDMITFTPQEAESSIRAFKGRCAQFIFCSTVDVYRKPASRYPITEDAERGARESFPYAYDKVICEERLEAAHARGDFALTTIRPAHTYVGGIPDDFRSGTHIFDRIRRGKPIIVHGDGNSLWSACHRDDVGRAFVNAIGNEKTYGKAYHVTGDEWMTWNRYYQGVAEAMNAPKPELVYIPTDLLAAAWPSRAGWALENFQYNNIFDNAAARADLGFEYTIQWVDGMRRAVADLEARDAIENTDDHPYYDAMIEAWRRCGADLANAVREWDTNE